MSIDSLIDTITLEDPRPKRPGPTAALLLATLLSLTFSVGISGVLLMTKAGQIQWTFSNPILAIQLIFIGWILIAAVPLLRKLCIPGRPLTGRDIIVLAAPFIAVLFLCSREISSTPWNELTHHTDKSSRLDCLWQIPAFSIPAFVILCFAARRLAPTNLRLTGLILGLVAGGIGTAGYLLHCHDDFLSVAALSYILAIAEVALLGALLASTFIRWR